MSYKCYFGHKATKMITITWPTTCEHASCVKPDSQRIGQTPNLHNGGLERAEGYINNLCLKQNVSMIYKSVIMLHVVK